MASHLCVGEQFSQRDQGKLSGSGNVVVQSALWYVGCGEADRLAGVCPESSWGEDMLGTSEREQVWKQETQATNCCSVFSV